MRSLRIPGTTISPTTMTGMAPMCFGASAGFTMPSMRPKAARTSAMVASNPVRTAYTCIRFDTLMVLRSSLPIYAL